MYDERDVTELPALPLTPYQIDALTDHIENPRANRTAINRLFREQDDSHLPPIRGRFHVVDRAIKQAQRWMNESGVDMAGLEYALFLHDAETRIVNNENNW